jgi:hypothetical protein
MYEKAEQILAAGADIEARDERGRTLLSQAASQREGRATLELLVGAAANLETKDIQGRTPLMFAAAIHEHANVECLVGEGANIAATDNDGRTALDWAREPDMKAEGFRQNHQVIEFLRRVYLQSSKLTQLDGEESRAHGWESQTHEEPPTRSDKFAEFKHRLEHEWKRINHEGKEFYIPSAISNWMADGNPSNAARLLDNVYPGGRFRQLQASQLLTPGATCVIVFAILLSLDHGHLIYFFHKHNVTDSRIEQLIDIKNSYLARDLKNEKTDPVKVLSEFEHRRWAFHPVPLSYLMHPSLQGSRWILPFNKSSRIAQGGTSTVYRVLVEKDLLPPEFRKRVREASQVVESLKGVSLHDGKLCHPVHTSDSCL